MFYDLNVPWPKEVNELQRTIAFLDELGYDVVALTHTYTGRLPPDLTPPIPSTLPFPVPPRMRILRRCNIFLTDSASNFRIPQLQQNYDLIAARPTDEKTLQSACFSLDVDIISLDLTQKFGTHFKFPMLGHAISKGIKIELCYGQAVLGDAIAKRNLIGNATQLIRATRGRGLIISSEAKTLLAARAPGDIINLASVWGLGTERGKEAVSTHARSVVEHARLKRDSFKGIVDVIYGGEKPPPGEEQQKDQKKGKTQPKDQKRKATQSLEGTPVSQSGEEKISKRQMKRNKKARTEGEQ
ncbi:PHP domain-like protein [Periconia macrospinosa]|uniref:PHP domain-like protein n=1 Tax=Periconia macrospinosa TaxID=97972 RepID=A0A2V1EEJ0_9PLEO|nr:PHP domain-like protein [Periconia macrospinosa]